MANELILVVEDNDKNRKLVQDVLTFKGYEIIEAETREEDVINLKTAKSLGLTMPPSVLGRADQVID